MSISAAHRKASWVHTGLRDLRLPAVNRNWSSRPKSAFCIIVAELLMNSERQVRSQHGQKI